MSIFLLILKILGIILLSIIGLVLLVLALVLFVPIRYCILGDKPEEGSINADVKVTWLLHIINFKFKYFEEITYRLRLFIFTLYKSENLKTDKEKEKEKKKEERKKKKTEKKEKRALKKAERQKRKDSNINDETVPDIALSNDGLSKTSDIISDLEIDLTSDEIIDNQEKEEVEGSKEADETEVTKEAELTEETEEKKSIFTKIKIVIEKLTGFIFNLKDKILSILIKIKDIWENIEYYIEAINDERNKKAFELCKKQIFKVLNSIKPRKIKGNLRYGSDDPYNVGKLMSIYGILFPIIHDKIQIVPEYDMDVIEGDIFIKGKITLFVIIKAGVIYLFNKDIKRMKKILKKE